RVIAGDGDEEPSVWAEDQCLGIRTLTVIEANSISIEVNRTDERVVCATGALIDSNGVLVLGVRVRRVNRISEAGHVEFAVPVKANAFRPVEVALAAGVVDPHVLEFECPGWLVKLKPQDIAAQARAG